MLTRYGNKKRLVKYARKKINRALKFYDVSVSRPRIARNIIGANKPVLYRNSISVSLTGNATGTLGTGYGRNFKADDITDITDIMSLYDFYRIQSIEVRFIPSWNVAGNSTSVAVPMYFVFDPTSSTAPTSAAEMMNFSKCRIQSTARAFKMKFTPSMFQSIGVLSSNEYQSVKTNKLWLTNTDTLAYGFRMWIDPINVNSAPVGTLIYTYNILARFQS